MSETEDRLSIRGWARQAWDNGVREDSHLGEAKAYLDAALREADPVSALIDAVDAVMHAELHDLAVARERDMGEWEDPQPEPEPRGRGRNRTPRKRHRKSSRKQ